jgi:hypothetical protein
MKNVYKEVQAGHQWLTPAILATWKAEIRKISVRSQTGQIVCDTLSQKHQMQNRVAGVAQVVSTCLTNVRP